MPKLIKKLALAAVPVIIYFAMFIYFEPYDYFGLKNNEYSGDSAVYRVREFIKNPSDIIIMGDSKLAHFDMTEVEKLTGEKVGQLSFGGASLNESMDLLEYALEVNPDVHTIYFGVSFYTLNESYYKDRMSQIETIASNPFAYMLSFNYNIEMLSQIRWWLLGIEDVASIHHEDWKEEDYYFEDGTKRPYRKNLMEYADLIYGVCENYVLDTADLERYVEIAKMCQEKGIKLYTVMPPIDLSLRELVVEKLGLEEHILTFIDRVSPYSEVLNYEYPPEQMFSEEYFYDGFHMDAYSGLPVFTQMLFDR